MDQSDNVRELLGEQIHHLVIPGDVVARSLEIVGEWIALQIFSHVNPKKRIFRIALHEYEAYVWNDARYPSRVIDACRMRIGKHTCGSRSCCKLREISVA